MKKAYKLVRLKILLNLIHIMINQHNLSQRFITKLIKFHRQKVIISKGKNKVIRFKN